MNALRSGARFIGRYYSILLLLIAYELLGRLGIVSPRLLPSLVLIWEQLVIFIFDKGDLLYHAYVSLYRALMGFFMAVVAGVLIGTLMARSKWVEALIDPIFTFGYPIPKISLYPVFIFVFGLGTESKVALVFLECIYPIAIHAHAGMRSADRVLVWAGRNMGASQTQLFFKVLVPAALPTLFTGLRIALPVALIVTVVTEIIGESRGLGFFITFASASFEYARALAAFVVIAVIGFILDRGLVLLRDRIVFWQRTDSVIG